VANTFGGRCELQRFFKREVPCLPRRHLGDHEVAVVDRPLEDRSRMPLRRQRPSWGPDGEISVTQRAGG
jgi:hypothetical protein